MALEKLSHHRFRKKSSIIADQIFRRIKNGEYRVGSKLPPERVIADQVGVSRPSVREAISALQIAGIVESRPGDGTYVCSLSDSENFAYQAFRVLEESDSPLEVLQARKAMEIGVARLAITVARDADIRRIKDSWKKKYEAGLRGDYVKYLNLASEFHISIARATKNHVIERMMDNLLSATRQPLWINMRRVFYQEDKSRIKEMLEVHGKIIDAIQERNTEKAIAAIEEHFDILIKRTYKGNNEDNGING